VYQVQVDIINHYVDSNNPTYLKKAIIGQLFYQNETGTLSPNQNGTAFTITHAAGNSIFFRYTNKGENQTNDLMIRPTFFYMFGLLDNIYYAK